MHTKRWYYYNYDYYYYYSIATAKTATKDSRCIFHRSQVIAHFVPSFIAMATRVKEKCGLQRSMAQPQKTPL